MAPEFFTVLPNGLGVSNCLADIRTRAYALCNLIDVTQTLKCFIYWMERDIYVTHEYRSPRTTEIPANKDAIIAAVTRGS